MFRDGEDLELALVDDSRVFQFAWRLEVGEQAALACFDSPRAFWDRASTDTSWLSRLKAVVIDNRFPGTTESGIAFAERLRECAPWIRLILSSVGHFPPSEVEVFDLVIDKSPISVPALLGTSVN